jgi:hypothetical protein
MGKMAMVIVLGLTLAAFFLGYAMSHSNAESVRNISGYFKYSTARNIAHTAVNIALHQWETDGVRSYTGEVMGGTYRVDTLYVRSDTIAIKSVGMFVDTSYTMLLTLYRYAKPFPTGNGGAPVSIAVDSVNYQMTGSTLIDARQHDSNGGLLPDSTASLGVAVLTSYDSAQVAGYGNKIIGDPDVVSTAALSAPAQYVEEYMASHDYYYSSGVYSSNMTWGSASDPKIVYCDASAGTVKFAGTIEGWGILVVRGSLTLAGNFAFHGLVIVYQEGDVDNEFYTEKGTPQIIGELWVAGDSGSQFVMKGNAQILRSSDAVDDAEHMKKLLAYRILSWYE